MFPWLTYPPPARRTAREMGEVVTLSCRATSASESLGVVTDSLGYGFGALSCYGMPPCRSEPPQPAPAPAIAGIRRIFRMALAAGEWAAW